jgi:hypothetical protein
MYIHYIQIRVSTVKIHVKAFYRKTIFIHEQVIYPGTFIRILEVLYRKNRFCSDMEANTDFRRTSGFFYYRPHA